MAGNQALRDISPAHKPFATTASYPQNRGGDNYGDQCDAMDPRDLRALVEKEIKQLIELVAWEGCEIVNKVEQASRALPRP